MYEYLERAWGTMEDLWDGSGAQGVVNEHLGPNPEPVTPGTGTRDPLSMLPRDENGNPIPVTRETLPLFIQQRWLESMNAGIDPAVAAAGAANGATPNTYRAGSQAAGTMTDFYGVPVTLPEGMTPEQLLAMMRDNPNGVGGGGQGQDQFGNMVQFPQAGPGGRQVGDHADLDVLGPDNGLIIYNDTDVSDGEVSANTGLNTESGIHPVSGQRAWGFVPYGDGQYMFYTAGSDSHNTIGTDVLGAGMQHQTWMAMSRALQEHVREAGGSADDIVFDRERQDTALMNRDPGTLTLADIAQDGEMQSDQRGWEILGNWRDAAQGTDTQVDDYLLMAGETAGDGAGMASRYVGNGLDWVGEETGWWDMEDNGWQFSAGDVVETGEDVYDWGAGVASDAYDIGSGVVDSAGSMLDSAGSTLSDLGSGARSRAEDLFSSIF